MDATSSELDAHALSPGARELRASLMRCGVALEIFPISTAGAGVADGLLVTRLDSRRMRIWPYGRLWMIRPEMRDGGCWRFLTDARGTTADPRRAVRAACSGAYRTAGLVAGWIVSPDPHAFRPEEG